ncbi:alpha/beta hydrolase [Actinoplanes sp. NPDC020271]|uniref:alpha/beta hydrolase n=1 Tax=Actinoplanes sp. NPDC020271 TaxID=3363896 RepID=UPI0037B52C63
MSEITLQQVAETNAASFSSAADAWSRVASNLDAGLEKYIAAGQYLPAVWPTGTAAEERFAALRTELSNTYEPCRKISSALRTHADTVLSLQGMLSDIQSECAAAGLAVDLATGTVSSKNHLTDATEAAQVAGLVQSYNGQLNELLTRARDLDRETAEALGQLPPPKPGSGKTGPKIAKEDLAALAGKNPAQVRDWWNSLTRDQQDQAIHDFPRDIGWLDGVPAVDRDKANRFGLDLEKQSLNDRLAAADSWYERQEVLHELGRVETIEKGLQKLGPRGLLLGFDTSAYSGDGKLVVALGNPDTARHTGVWVPGLSTTLDSTSGNIERIMKMNNAADALTRESSGDVSTVYWLGYDAPDLDNASVFENERSMAGRDPYLDFMQGLRATHETDGGHLVAMGHSYGSTVVGEAAKTHQLPVDDIVVAGSPGMHVDSASDLMVDPKHVWAGASASDPVAHSGAWLDSNSDLVDSSPLKEFAETTADDLHGVAPDTPSFGANSWKADTHGHTHYWDDNSESLQNQSRVLAGVYNKVTLNNGTPPENWR